MSAVAMQEITERMDEVIDRLDASAKQYPVKKLAWELKSELTSARAESTLRNELNQQQGYKLGLVTAVQIMAKTGELAPLDLIEDIFRRVAFRIPEADAEAMKPIITLVSRLSKEFGEAVREVGFAIEDNRINLKEVNDCLKELDDLIKVGIELKAYLAELRRKLRR